MFGKVWAFRPRSGISLRKADLNTQEKRTFTRKLQPSSSSFISYSHQRLYNTFNCAFSNRYGKIGY